MNHMKQSLGILTALVLFFAACQKEDKIETASDFTLAFSTDTVTFDTVFTTIGSATQNFRIHNHSNKTARISQIALAGGQQSFFRLNLDGESGTQFTDVEIAPGDSLFAFVRVTIDPNDKNLPFICQDSIVFMTNQNLQDVDLIAWGQNAHFHQNVLLQGVHVWQADKPHVIYGFAIVDDTLDSRLYIEPGAQIYMHQGAVLAADSSASIKIQGTQEAPVTITNDRLEEAYKNIPGQWGYIWLAAGSLENEIHHALIKNGTIGVRVDTLGNSTQPTLLMTNSHIHNMQGYGLLAQGSKVNVRNTVISNCGLHAVVLNIGGSYDLRHCTIANFYDYGARQSPSVLLTNYYIYENDTIPRPLENAYFGNCIIDGNLDEEIGFSTTTQAAMQYTFDNCLIKTSRELEDESRFPDSFVWSDSLYYRNPAEYDYHIDSLISTAIDAGKLRIITETTDFDLRYDKDGLNRTLDGKPDLGAYEFREEQ
jgi:hypothetical protein